MVKKCREEEREKLYALWEIEIIMNRQFSLYYLPSTDNIDTTSTHTQTKYRKTKKKKGCRHFHFYYTSLLKNLNIIGFHPTSRLVYNYRSTTTSAAESTTQK